jgi:hypothetical protein
MGWFRRCFGIIIRKKKQKGRKAEPPSREHLLKSTQEESENTKGAQYKYDHGYPAVRDKTEQASKQYFGDLDGASLREVPVGETLQIVIAEVGFFLFLSVFSQLFSWSVHEIIDFVPGGFRTCHWVGCPSSPPNFLSLFHSYFYGLCTKELILLPSFLDKFNICLWVGSFLSTFQLVNVGRRS